MKIAVTTEENQVFQHFGKCPVFTLFTVRDGAVQEKIEVDASAHGHAALTGFLKDLGVQTVICGGIGEGAKQMLRSAGITLVSGVQGNIDDAVASFLSGGLSDLGGTCAHHDHQENHTCDCSKNSR